MSTYSYRNVVTALLLISYVFCFNGCSNDEQPKPKKLTSVTVGITESFVGEAAFFVAQNYGYFEDFGLDISTKRNASGRHSLRDLLQRKVEIAHVAETPIVYSLLDTTYYQNLDSPPFQIFAEMISATEIQHIMARRDHGIASPKDLIGKKVAVYNGTQLEFFLDSFLLEHQIDPDSLQIINMKPAKQVRALSKGNIDAAVVWEPYATKISQQLEKNGTILNTKLTYSTLWMTTALNKYANEHAQVLTQYLKALQKAQDFIKNNPDKTQKLLANQISVPINAIEATWDDIDFELLLSERMITLLNDQARWLQRKGLADTSGIDFRSLINFTTMRTVKPGRIRTIQ